MVVAKESYACINYITLFLQELLHQRIGFCTKVIYYAPKSRSSLNCIVFSSVIDSCMGSGHILVCAFDVLMHIYPAVTQDVMRLRISIVRNNLWGLDLDKRAYQLAHFAVMMKARQYDRHFLGRDIKPSLSYFQDLPVVNYSMLDEPIKSFVQQFENTDTYGSLISVQADDEIDKALDEFEGMLDLSYSHMEHLMQLYKILSQRYDVFAQIHLIWQLAMRMQNCLITSTSIL